LQHSQSQVIQGLLRNNNNKSDSTSQLLAQHVQLLDHEIQRIHNQDACTLLSQAWQDYRDLSHAFCTAHKNPIGRKFLRHILHELYGKQIIFLSMQLRRTYHSDDVPISLQIQLDDKQYRHPLVSPTIAVVD